MPSRSGKKTVTHPQGTDAEMLDELQRSAFDYFVKEVNPENGLIADRNEPASPASTAVIGLGISVYIAGVRRNLISRKEAASRVLSILKFFHASPQGPEPETTGYKGFYYHFLNMQTGRRASECELSTIDTAMLIAGALHAASYFTGEDAEEKEIVELAEALYRKVDWQWALNGGKTISHGWKPESGFLPDRWDRGYSEAQILYVLAAGSPVFPIDPEGYREWTSSFRIRTDYDLRYIYAGPLFIHQLSQVWLDLRGISDDASRRAGIDYFENSRRATYVHRQYAIENPRGFKQYGEYVWGFTASNGPGPAKIEVDGVQRRFYAYTARGAPLGPDDGTVSPWAVAASIPFAPEIVIDSIRHCIERLELSTHTPYGFESSFNPTWPKGGKSRSGWVSPWILGLNQAPVVLMIENFQTGLIWENMRVYAPIVDGLRRLGFRGGWMDAGKPGENLNL